MAASWEKSRQAKLLVIAYVEQGYPVDDALQMADVSTSRHTRWKQIDEEYRDRFNAAYGQMRILAAEKNYTDGIPGDFQGFVERFFPDRDPHLPHQLALVRELHKMEPREVVLFLLWPESGKSATVEDHICRTLARDPDHRFRVVSQTDDHGKKIVGFCKNRFTDTVEWPEFVARFGPFHEKNQERSGRPWGESRIKVLKATGTERDYSIVATGWRGATTGSRIDTLIWDDVQVPENYNQAEDIFKRLRSAFFSRSREMRTLIVGHRIGPGDVYDRLKDAGLITREVVLPAEGGGSNFSAEAGEPTIPQWWDRDIFHTGGACCGGLVQFRTCPNDGTKLTPREYMELMRHIVGEESWFSMYQQDPVASELTTFSQWVADCLDHNRSIGPLVGV